MEESERAAMNELSGAIIGAAIEVHRTLGPGYLEQLYESALCIEMRTRHSVRSTAGHRGGLQGRDDW
jgi:hypothetical protein